MYTHISVYIYIYIHIYIKVLKSYGAPILNTDVSIEYWNAETGQGSSPFLPHVGSPAGQGSSPFLPPVGSSGPSGGQDHSSSSLSPSLTGVSASASTSSNNMTNTVTNEINAMTNPVTNLVTNNPTNWTNELLQQFQKHSVLITTELSDMKKKYIIQLESYENLKKSHLLLEASREVGKKCKKSLKKIYKKISNFLELYAKDLDSEEMFSPRTEGIERSIMSSPPPPPSDTEVFYIES
jgi:hypothetical protein